MNTSTAKEEIVAEVLRRSSPVGRNQLEKELRADIEQYEDDDMPNYFVERGVPLAQRSKQAVEQMTPLDLEQATIKAQDMLANGRGEIAKQQAWSEYRALTHEAKRRRQAQGERQIDDLRRQQREAQELDAARDKAIKDAEKARVAAQEAARRAEAEARERRLEAERVYAQKTQERRNPLAAYR